MNFLQILTKKLEKQLNSIFSSPKNMTTLVSVNAGINVIGSSTIKTPRTWREPYTTISTIVEQYTNEIVCQGDSQLSAHEKIRRCLEEMDNIIADLTLPTASNLIHPNDRVRAIAKEKHDKNIT